MPIRDPQKLKAARARDNAKRAGKRTRGWACIVYPESAPKDWAEKLRSAHIETLISPLHDQDIQATGELKKAHYHVLAMFPQPVPESAAVNYFSLAGVKSPPEMVKNLKGYARYLVHLDDHDKHRYAAEDVQALAGASWKSVALDEGEMSDAILDEIEDWIEKSGCISYAALCKYARAERPDWTPVIRTRTIHLSALLKSAFWDAQQVLQVNLPVSGAKNAYRGK